jgi:hypothetical protein
MAAHALIWVISTSAGACMQAWTAVRIYMEQLLPSAAYAYILWYILSSKHTGCTCEGPLAEGAGGGSTTCVAAKAPVAAADSRYRYLDMLACCHWLVVRLMSILIWLAKHYC